MKVVEYLRLIRITHWTKNAFVFVPLIFSRNLFDQSLLFQSVLGFLAFCLVSSITYIINDIADREVDAKHPKKQKRPIASGAISIKNAIVIAVIFIIGLVILLGFLKTKFIIVVILYVVINLIYTYYLKHKVLFDIFSIATGFILRVMGGAFVIDVAISGWLILTTMFLSLYLASMKRYSELLLAQQPEQQPTRIVLQKYSSQFINQLITITAGSVIICYALYTVSPRTVTLFRTENLIYTTPFVVFGIFRYMHKVYTTRKGENPIELMVTDLPMIVNVLLYVITTILIVYHYFGL